MENSFDFIVVGAGPAGALLASRLAKSPAAPSVLLIEAGEANEDAPLDQRMLSNRATASLAYPNLNWGYKTVPQPQLANRTVDYSRGKGLGGSSLINYAFWTIPPADDYDKWASLVDDDSFCWKNMQRRLKKIERYHYEDLEGGIREFFSPNGKDHGSHGELDVEVPKVIEPEIVFFLADMKAAGSPINLDLNSGNPIGLGLVASTSRKAIRTTAKSAFLSNIPRNLTVKTDSPVDRVVLQDGVATGVESNGKIFHATKEVIICAGALDSPKLLMLSGIGDAKQLKEHGIPVVRDLPGVGKNLQDHPMLLWGYQRKAAPKQSYSAWHDESIATAARRQLELDGTGPFAVNGQGFIVGFLKDNSTLASPTFQSLPPSIQSHFHRPTVPTFECVWSLIPGMDPQKSYLGAGAFLQNPQSVGSVRLASADPSDAPVCDPKILSHPFDRVGFVNAVKAALNLPGCPVVTGDVEVPLNAPTDDDEAVWGFIQRNAATAWHMSCTVKMGRVHDEDSCVDTEFRVRGIGKLRVADMSVTPFLPSAHPMSTAYLIGETAAEKIIAEYGLDARTAV